VVIASANPQNEISRVSFVAARRAGCAPALFLADFSSLLLVTLLIA
jgi:hypothetical protein